MITIPVSCFAAHSLAKELSYAVFMTTVLGGSVILVALHTIVYRMGRKPGPECAGETSVVTVSASPMQGPPYRFTFANPAYGEAFRKLNPYSDK